MRAAILFLLGMAVGLAAGAGIVRLYSPRPDTAVSYSEGLRIGPNLRAWCDPWNGVTVYVYRDGWSSALAIAGGDCRTR